MTIRSWLLPAVLLGLALPSWSAAQGLGGAAASEKARRTLAPKKGDEGKSFTNVDLEKGRPPVPAGGAATAPAAAPAAGAAASSEASAPIQDRNTEEKPLLDAISAAQERVSAVEEQIRVLGDKLNPMSGSFIYGAGGSNSVAEEQQTRQQLTRSQGELAQARQAVAEAQEALRTHRGSSEPPAPR